MKFSKTVFSALILMSAVTAMAQSAGVPPMGFRAPMGTNYTCGSLVPSTGPDRVDPSIYGVILYPKGGGMLREVSHNRPPVFTPLTLKQRGMEQQTFLAGDFEIKVTEKAFVGGIRQLPDVTISQISNPAWKATCRHSKSLVN